MKRNLTVFSVFALFAAANAYAGDADSSATAGGGHGRNGDASATASYEGDVGFARTRARSGPISTARGVAVGVDQDGLSLSISNAIATHHGLALASTLNISIERDGDVAISRGVSRADGAADWSATAGGSSTTRHGAAAVAHAAGRSDPSGRVAARTWSQSRRDGERRVARKPVFLARK
ncbi:MAG: hypothetical protein CHACPFDD_01455 [Phycisphaerae bacterium]|nr:hypothetical protein [Phycisphaerae bacterium]